MTNELATKIVRKIFKDFDFKLLKKIRKLSGHPKFSKYTLKEIADRLIRQVLCASGDHWIESACLRAEKAGKSVSLSIITGQEFVYYIDEV